MKRIHCAGSQKRKCDHRRYDVPLDREVGERQHNGNERYDAGRPLQERVGEATRHRIKGCLPELRFVQPGVRRRIEGRWIQSLPRGEIARLGERRTRQELLPS
jgi:hypothetical protein